MEATKDPAERAAQRAAAEGRSVFAWVTRESVTGRSKELVALGTDIGSIEAAGWSLDHFVSQWTALDGAHRTTLLFRKR